MISDAVKILFALLAFVLIVAFYFRLRILFAGLKVTSWWRGTDKNARVKGRANSKHLIGWAFDVVPANKVTMDKLKAMGFAKVINEANHIHVQVI